MQDHIKQFWIGLTILQKRVVAGIGLLFIAFLLSGWFSAFKTWNEIRPAKRAASKAKAKAKRAEENADKYKAAAKKVRDYLITLEAKRDDKRKEFENAGEKTRKDRADYDRARREPVKRVPTIDELCTEFESLGIDCKPIADSKGNN